MRRRGGEKEEVEVGDYHLGGGAINGIEICGFCLGLDFGLVVRVSVKDGWILLGRDGKLSGNR